MTFTVQTAFLKNASRLASARNLIRTAAVGLLIVASCQLASAVQQPASTHPPAHTKAPSATQLPSASEDTRAANKDRVVSPLLSKIWWNQPKKIEALALTTQQRKAMDALLSAFLEQRSHDRLAQIEAFEAFGQALGVHGAQAAKAKTNAIGQAVAAPVERQTALMIAVIDKLSAEQREQLIKNFPRLLKRPWVRHGSPLTAPISMSDRVGRRGRGKKR